MYDKMFRLKFASACCALLLGGSALAAPPLLVKPLLSDSDALAAKNPQADAVHAAVSADPATLSTRVVEADAALVAEDASALRIDLAPGVSLLARRDNAYRNPDGTIVWSGSTVPSANVAERLDRFGHWETPETPLDTALIVRNGDKLTGTVRSNGRLYRIQPLRNGGHVVQRIDETRMPPDHPAGHRGTPILPMPRPVALPPGDEKAPTVIRVGILFNNSASSAVGDVVGLSNLAVAESNQGYANSGVDITLQLAGVYTTTYTSAGFSTDLSRFRGTSDGYLDSWHATRNSIAADVNVLVINDASSCGIGYLHANAASAFSVVHYGCATGYYSFAHEIGHNMGAHHDPASGTNTVYPYGHGYRHPGSAWRTIMAYNCTSGCPRINYWSNPARTYGGAPMGTAATHNNARVLNERRATVAAFR